MSQSSVTVRQALNISELTKDPTSFLALGVEDATLRKLESYRLRKLGYSAEQIAQTLDFSRSHLYYFMKEFEKKGTPALIKKNWGATTRKLTTTKEAQILRAKALNPHRSDRDLAGEFDLDRRTVYGLLKEHGLQDLHRVLVGNQANDTPENICASSELEIIPCQPALLLTLLPYISTTGALNALSGLGVRSPSALYSDQQLQLSLLLMAASGVLRLTHSDGLPVSGWAIPLSTSRRVCSDTLDHYLQQVIDLDEQGSQQSVIERLGAIRPGGLIEQAQLKSLRLWVEAGLTDSQIWNFDGHVIEYTGAAGLDKTKHGTKARAVKAIKRFTISNGLCVLDYYCPAHTTFADACRHLIKIANQALGPDHQIRFLAFDREGWDKALLDWLHNFAHVNPITWVKRTSKTVKQLNSIPDADFKKLPDEIKVGKKKPKVAQRWADTQIEFDQWGSKRVVILETSDGKRLGIYSSAIKASNLSNERSPRKQEASLESKNIIDQSTKLIVLPDKQPPATPKISVADSEQSSRASSISGSSLSKTSDKREASTPFCAIQSPINGRQKSKAPVIAKSYLSESDQQQAFEGTYQVADTISTDSQDEPHRSPIAYQVANTISTKSQNYPHLRPIVSEVANRISTESQNESHLRPIASEVADRISTGNQDKPVLGSLAHLGQKVATVVNQAFNKVKQQFSLPSKEEQKEAHNQEAHNQEAHDQEGESLSANELILAMRHRQRLENQFKVEVNEMDSDAIPTHKIYEGTIKQAYNVDEAEHKVELAQARLLKYKQQKEEQKSLYEQGKINKYQLNELQKRTARLQRNTEKELDSLSSQLNQTEVDSSGQALVIFRWKYWTSEKWSCLI